MDIQEHTTAKLSAKGGSALSIVLAGIAAAYAAHDEYERKHKAHKQADEYFPSNYYERAADEQDDLYYALLDVMPYLPATGLVDAAAQVAQIANVISALYDELPDTDEVNRAFRKTEKKVSLLVHSAVRAIESHGNFSLVAMGLESIRGSNLDPWAEADETVADLKRRGA